ncbi:uncharacterized protein LOC141620518 [Silene latifolia]|uniref:uncharacterized protein LOC141620518 n=1 Tax=Silene latifolia TaxID=37657 RepID=UPI003D771E5A
MAKYKPKYIQCTNKDWWFLVNKDWCDIYPDKYAHFLPEGLFDHSPCLVRSTNSVQGKSSFKYLNMWGSSKDFLGMLLVILKASAKLRQEVEGLQKQLGMDPDNQQLQQQEYEASQELKIKSLARDNFLYQKAKIVWIKDGDSNSAYFHNTIKQRRNKNRVIMIEE